MTLVTIAQLYPAELGITGDRGNVRAIERRLAARGVETTTVLVAPGEELPRELDVLVIGNGPLSALRGVHADLIARKGRLDEFVADGGVLFSVGGSAELLGERLDAPDGETLDGIGVLPYRVVRVSERRVGYIIVDTPHGPVVGFEDHASEWTLTDAASAYGTVRDGHGSFGRDEGRGEFVRVGNTFASNVQGPVLPLNPELTDVLVDAVAERRGLTLSPARRSDLDEYAEAARTKILMRPTRDKGFKTIQV
ncbi:glutamine amidotransferase [Microbacterium bovistercoris]|uniref:Lipid II isoglutaminyl synthase (glutamine-hydrolyzing) subunit GatD n=1 Tax=Microbacterium bovistercoris TaxID=2293570 RepID=A0A371NUU9_9MICO|nr:glutamine amidotransferase [Microbacterium bovistercoris]REJ05559.1 glutamine amidotransferase [Microbacterium bovistercoris]